MTIIPALKIVLREVPLLATSNASMMIFSSVQAMMAAAPPGVTPSRITTAKPFVEIYLLRPENFATVTVLHPAKTKMLAPSIAWSVLQAHVMQSA